MYIKLSNGFLSENMTKQFVIYTFLAGCKIPHLDGFVLFGVFFVIRTLHDCPSQMNENLLISNSKLTSDSELIW